MDRMDGLVKGLIASALLVGGVSAEAATVPLTNGSGPGPTLAVGDVGSFGNTVSLGPTLDDVTDKWYFSLPTASGVGSSVASIVLDFLPLSGPEYNFSSLSFSLHAADESWTSSLTSAGSSLVLTSLAAGTYYVDVVGDANGSLGGAYSGIVAVSAVPLPAAAWLMLSGLLGLGAVARRRVGVSGAAGAAA